MKFHLMQLNHCPIFEQLQIEEALLRLDQRNWILLNTGTTPAIVMGISGKLDLLLNTERLKHDPVPVIRRFSGGGTVYVDDDTCFITTIVNVEEAPITPFPKEILHWHGSLYKKVLAPHPFQVEENDYTLGSRKFGGNAQYLTKKRWLHHTSLLWNYSVDKMDYLLMPPKVPSYRKMRDHGDFLCPLSPLFPNKETFFQRFVGSVEESYEMEEVRRVELAEILQKEHRRSTHYEKNLLKGF